MTWLNRLCLGLTLVMAATAAHAAPEQRCSDLGSNCLCSEPLNNNDGAVPGLGDVGFPWDPSDTDTKECGPLQKSFNPGGAFLIHDTSANGIVRTVPASGLGLPAGIDYVLERGDGHGSTWDMEGRAEDFPRGAQRSCMRWYMSIDSLTNFGPASGPSSECPFNHRSKLMTTNLPTTPGCQDAFQLSEAGDNSAPCTDHGGIAVFSNHFRVYETALRNSQGKAVSFADCVNPAWCRVEVCVFADDLGASKMENLGFASRIVPTDTRDVYEKILNLGTWESGNGQSCGPIESFTHNQYHNTTRKGTAWYSHFMQAEWSSNNGQWIGAAAEIEGPGVNPPDPNPDPEPNPGPDPNPDPEPNPDPNPDPGTPPSSGASGLPFSDDFEHGVSHWHDGGLGSGSGPFVSSFQSLQGDPVSGTQFSGWLSRFWGDARSVCSSCPACGDDCPGGRTDEAYAKFHFRLQGNDPQIVDRKLATLGSFVDWNANICLYQNNSAYYFTILVGEYGGADGLDIAFNSWRRHDGQGEIIADIVDSAIANDVIEANRWHELEVRAQLNSVGQSNGVLQMWLDGDLVIDRRDMDFRGGYTDTAWNYLMLTDNGVNAPNSTVQVFWDDVSIGTERIGMDAPSPGDPPGGGEPTPVIGTPGRPYLLP